MFSKDTIKLPPELRARAAEAATRAGYSSLDEFIAHVMEQELQRLKENEAAEDLEIVTRRLKGLGYLE
jgi:hypothetical protein